jgi:glutaredoxin
VSGSSALPSPPSAAGDAVEVVLYEGAGCGLCARALALLEAQAPQLGFALHRVAIDGDAELENRYRIDLPVVVIDGEIAFTAAVAAGPLARAVGLAQARRREGSS